MALPYEMEEAVMIKITGIALLILLGGCATLDRAAVGGAKAADRVLATAEWTLCEVATRGSLKRRYGTSTERAKSYKEFCDGNSTVNFIEPE